MIALPSPLTSAERLWVIESKRQTLQAMAEATWTL